MGSRRFVLRGMMLLLIACGGSATTTGAGSSSGGSSSGQLPDGARDPGDGGEVIIGPDGEIIEAPPPPPVYVKTTKETMTVAGESRHYILGVPLDYDAAKSYPLVMSFHGNPGTAEGMASGLPFDPVSKKEAIIVYPNALGLDWNLDVSDQDNADLRFVKELVDALAAQYSIDKTRVFGVGWSGGGFFVNTIACRLGGLMRAMSVHAGGAPISNDGNAQKYPNGCVKCESAAPTATIIFHGDQDPVVEFGSGDYDATCWATYNGCQSSRSATTPTPCVTSDGCAARTPVTFCPVPGGGHGVSPDGFSTAWAFFKALPP